MGIARSLRLMVAVVPIPSFFVFLFLVLVVVGGTRFCSLVVELLGFIRYLYGMCYSLGHLIISEPHGFVR